MEFNIEIFTDNKPLTEIENEFEDKLSIFQTVRWLEIINKDYISIVCFKEKQVVAYLPLVKTRKYGITAYHIPPYTPYFGPVIANEYLNKKSIILPLLIKEIGKAKNIDFKLKDVEEECFYFNNLGFKSYAVQNYFFPGEETYSLQSLKPLKRRHIKKLLNYREEGIIKVVENNASILGSLIDLLRVTSERAKYSSNINLVKKIFSSINPKDYYANLILDSNGNPLAGSFCPKDKKNMYHLLSVSTRVDDNILNNANSLALYLAVLNANSSGLDFDFEGSTLPGVANFYKLMGGKPRIIFRFTKTRSLFYKLLLFFKELKEAR